MAVPFVVVGLGGGASGGVIGEGGEGLERKGKVTRWARNDERGGQREYGGRIKRLTRILEEVNRRIDEWIYRPIWIGERYFGNYCTLV